MSLARTTYVTTAEREELMAKPVTLNGRPALISGRLAPFAMVRTNDGAGPPYVAQWAWPTIRRVIEESGGAFRL